ncbi:TadA family conjugal transfer-associated ATPase [uncultured Pseudokineococcus sp.]|uniref:TadA family conjugal transfer-associated ATPase n=1 Tax=uncultured Pseudokineococcus sp. TaxID=1642928 RepID=UPI00262630C0|nr:TadA family conjugal transfer-associated ATPase [uncultured Pseudokineococcus sp.]
MKDAGTGESGRAVGGADGPGPDGEEGVDERLLARVRTALSRSSGPVTPPVVVDALRASAEPLGTAGALRVAPRLGAALVGAGALQVLLDEPGVTDVLVNGPDAVWVDRGRGLRRAHVRLGDEAAVRALAVRLAAGAGRRLDDASPCVDARLPDGVRLHAVLPPVSPAGTLLSLRVPRREGMDLDQLVAAGSVPAGWALVLRRVVEHRLAFLVSGGTSSGKTTVLASLLGLADPRERVVLVEDAGELQPRLPHVVRLEARHGNVEGVGSVGLDELVRHALRMRPDRLVVGECRGAEVRDLLAALNTGHDGGCGTVHANTAADVPARLEALGALAGLDARALTTQAASALDVVLHLRRDARGRRMEEVALVGRRGDELVVVPALTASGPGPAWGDLAARLDLDPGQPPAGASAGGERLLPRGAARPAVAGDPAPAGALR